jgi:hypothetical protein
MRSIGSNAVFSIFYFMKQTYKTKDRVRSNTTGSLLTGTVIQSYWHLDGETGQSPHMRHVVRWDTGTVEDLWELEISLENVKAEASPDEL